MGIETETREALKIAMGEIYPGVVVKGDKLHGSLGTEDAIIGIYPKRTRPWGRDHNVLDCEVVVQYFNNYNLEVNPNESVDPAIIESKVDVLREKLKERIEPATSNCWYFEITEVNYPDDPTGNKSRFEATVLARGNNTAMI